MAKADRAVAEDMGFVPFAFVEAAANVLTNPALDPYGKIAEFQIRSCSGGAGVERAMSTPRRTVIIWLRLLNPNERGMPYGRSFCRKSSDL